jgi:hypothetical protein
VVGFRGTSDVRVRQGDANSLDSLEYRGALNAGYSKRPRAQTILGSIAIAKINHFEGD